LEKTDVAQFRSVSKIHNDGWGASLLSQPPEGAHRRDGGAPTPETASNVYRSTVAAHFDSAFDTMVESGARGGLYHSATGFIESAVDFGEPTAFLRKWFQLYSQW
jgi:hypothetical protein